ncbi:protein DpdH [Streptomyces albidoflavus]|uniref:protein DpdH n=1 Tax=Streptomyces albidoflavus TaxID=1886 RepID=UPI0008F54060|nr:protein DpdH [Streptomyces albidoflavus]
MSDFKGYVCWDVENVISTIQTEAVVASPAVFLSTHTPLSIQRSRITGRSFNSTGESVTEENVLDEFLNRRTNTRTLLLPVVGESGSGKSHLVRWVRENIEPAEDRKIIYLEKSKTSLRHVIDSLLDGVEDEEIEQIRKDIRHVTGNFTAASLARRLITQLSVALADLGKESVSGKKRQLVGPQGISLLLQDPLLQAQMLESGKFIPQFAQHFLSDRESGEERRPRFSLEDLPLSPDAIAGDMAAPTRQIFGVLMSRDELQVLAVELLNEQWDKAVQELSALGGGRLLGAMQKVRKIYARQGKEIILLVEDFALIQGVQGDLLDAITETSEREGHAVLAPMRTLMAITSGYFHDLPETAASRIATSTGGFVYNLDIVLGEGQTGTEDIATFVARYLNAARVGRGALESAGSGSIPNKCDDCIAKSLCHDSFGVSADGFGLYPFNRPSLTRVVHSLAPQENPYAFVPRNVLGSGVIPILADAYSAISKGEFPSAFFQENYKSVRGVDQALPNSVSEDIDTRDPLNAKRRRAALEFWADAPPQLVNLRQGISEAFSLPALAVDGLHEKQQVSPQKEQSTPLPPPQKEVPALQRKLQVVEDWAATGSRLTTDEAKIIRTIISKSVPYREDWLTPPVKPVNLTDTEKAGWYTKNVKSNQVSIEDASSEAMSAGAPIVLKRNPATGEFFKSLLRLSADAVDGVRGKDIVRLASIADAARPAMRERVAHSLERTEKDLIAGLRVSLLGAALAGRVVPGMPIETLYAEAFDVGNEWVRPDVSSRTEAWLERLNVHMQHRSSLVESLLSSLGIGQGSTGAVHVVDATRALPLVKEAAAHWDLSAVELPQWVKSAGQPLRAGWQSVVRSQLQELRTLFREIRERFPRASGPGDRLVQQVSTALQMAKAEGITGPLERELDSRAVAVAEADWTTLSVLEKDLSRVTNSLQDSSAESLLAVVAPIRSPHLRKMRDYLTVADSLLDTALAAARMQNQNAVSDAAEQLAGLLGEWKQAVDDASTHAEAGK